MIAYLKTANIVSHVEIAMHGLQLFFGNLIFCLIVHHLCKDFVLNPIKCLGKYWLSCHSWMTGYCAELDRDQATWQRAHHVKIKVVVEWTARALSKDWGEVAAYIQKLQRWHYYHGYPIQRSSSASHTDQVWCKLWREQQNKPFWFCLWRLFQNYSGFSHASFFCGRLLQ